MTRLAVRISCPDRPGVLGAVTSALGLAGANIESLDVVERAADMAVDDLVVEGERVARQGIVEALESVPGVVVDRVQAVPHMTGRRDPLDLVAALVDAVTDPYELLAYVVPEAFQAGWCAAVRGRTPQPEVIAASGTAPSLVGAGTPWLPIERARRLDAGPWVPRRWSLDARVASFAVARLSGPDEALLVVRPRGPMFLEAEVRDLANVARVAAALRAAAQSAPAASAP